MFLILRDKTIKLASIPSLVNLSKVLIGAVLVRFWVTFIFSLAQNHARNFLPFFKILSGVCAAGSGLVQGP